MDFSELETVRSYLGGMIFKTYATREYEYEITNTKLKGVSFRHSVYTPRVNEFDWGTQKNEFWVAGSEEVKYKTLEELKDNIKYRMSYINKHS